MSLNAYLNFDGNTREAVAFYREVFDSPAPDIMTFGEQPPNPEFEIPEEMKDRIMHAALKVNGSMLMFSDTFPGTSYIQGNHISLTVWLKDEALLRKQFDRIKQGGKVDMELQETFWSKAYGQVTDQFGIIWQFSHEGESEDV
ncbi:VOC family protein [Jeotgalibacillus sp. R-1-5s-1]|uniref:VOC family protein n=1 Tax=Jeotgalibacillus sp. R-1-5s-1 TaxID=2555897 RepID=UPI00106B802F|nr:VOC family protein [Jeotgalibacillus sp. R-1-5s-1]TFE00109.1 VOC family protein [Jeotgalibacillus sp. R-1-5s-1]